MKKFLLLSVVALLLAGATESFAQSRNREQRINDRHDGQRIRRGIRSGQITGEEARLRLERERQIRTDRRGYRSDGTRRSYNNLRNDRRRGNGYYRRGAGSPSHPVFGLRNRNRNRHRNRNY